MVEVGLMKKTFDDFYSSFWGSRWSSLKEALLAPPLKVRRYSFFAAPDRALKSFRVGLPRGCEAVEKATNVEQTRVGDEELGLYYVMDPASVLAARALPGLHGNCLDLCAAPGGKSLILAERILLESAFSQSTLICNELSEVRRERLKEVLRLYVPRKLREHIWIKGRRAYAWAESQPESFDAILLDAPCSGERHLLQNKTEFENWTPRRSERLAQEQYSLLCSAWLCLKPGGFLLYSTCSVSHLENDGVIEKFLNKKTSELVNPQLEIPGEVQKFGTIFLPDKSGFGPIYLTLLRRI